jgi:hypothetical protein
VPLFGLSFTGVIAGLFFNGHLYSFTTYNGSKAQVLSREQNHTDIIFSRGKTRLRLQADRDQGGELHAPTSAGMDRRIIESLNARIHVQLWKNGKLIFDEVGQVGGMEVVN